MEILISKSDKAAKEYSRFRQGCAFFRDAETGKDFNFKVVEFACKDGSDFLKVDSPLVFMLQKIREHFNKPVIINSGYRNAAYNKKVGGASRSQHIYGKAADICISGVDPLEIARYVESECELIKGIGLYTWGVHVDTRTTPAKWDYRSGKEIAVSTFLIKDDRAILSKIKEDYPPANNDTYEVKRGDTVWRICENNGLTLKEFREFNPNIKNIALIYPGQKVRIK